MSLDIRWMIAKDIRPMLAIERSSFASPWGEKEFKEVRRLHNTVGLVVEADDRIVGYVVYSLHKSELSVQNIAVVGTMRRRGIGRAMAGVLCKKLAAHKRNSIGLVVRETNVVGQLFFRAVGFRAIGIEREFFEDGDGYEMRYDLDRQDVESWLENVEVSGGK